MVMLVKYIFTTLEFPATHNVDFHLLTTSVNSKYYDFNLSWIQTLFNFLSNTTIAVLNCGFTLSTTVKLSIDILTVEVILKCVCI